MFTADIILIKTLIEILILWFVIYHILLFFEGTRALQVVWGIAILFVAFFTFQKLDLQVLDWLMTKLFAISVIAILIIFQPEIRQGLARLGQLHLFSAPLKGEELDYVLSQISKSSESLTNNKRGALIVLENNDPLTAYTESGILLDAKVSSELLETIFEHNSLLHDGGVIIRADRIVAAGCLFPLSHNLDISRIFGTRHRAALGLSEETDAVVIVISEERQDISLVHKGRFYRDLSKDDLLAKVRQIIKSKNVKNKSHV